MDVIGGIKYMDNRLGGRRPDQGKDKSAAKAGRHPAAKGENKPGAGGRTATEQDSPLGTKVDTSV